MPWQSRRCPRCGGDCYHDSRDAESSCLQCGWEGIPPANNGGDGSGHGIAWWEHTKTLYEPSDQEIATAGTYNTIGAMHYLQGIPARAIPLVLKVSLRTVYRGIRARKEMQLQ